AVTDALNVCRQDTKQEIAGLPRIQLQLFRADEVEKEFGKHFWEFRPKRVGCTANGGSVATADNDPKHVHRATSPRSRCYNAALLMATNDTFGKAAVTEEKQLANGS